MDDHGTAVTKFETTQIERVHPLVQQAMAQAPDPATLRELMQLQREWEAGKAKRAFTAALVGLKRDMPTVIRRDTVVDFTSAKGRTRYTHSSLAAAMDAVTRPLTAHGFTIAWIPSTADRGVTVTCRLTHTGGHSEEASVTAPADTSGNKNPAQAVASTITLLQRYTALSLLGIATADMDDPKPSEVRAGPDPHELVPADVLVGIVAKLKGYGKTTAETEEHVGKPAKEWTRVDLDKIAEWITAEGRAAGAKAAEEIDLPAFEEQGSAS